MNERLYKAVEELEYYYDVDKVKPYSVYVWTKGNDEDDFGENVFDIYKNEIVYFNKGHRISEEVMPIIKRIQEELNE